MSYSTTSFLALSTTWDFSETDIFPSHSELSGSKLQRNGFALSSSSFTLCQSFTFTTTSSEHPLNSIQQAPVQMPGWSDRVLLSVGSTHKGEGQERCGEDILRLLKDSGKSGRHRWAPPLLESRWHWSCSWRARRGFSPIPCSQNKVIQFYRKKKLIINFFTSSLLLFSFVILIFFNL